MIVFLLLILWIIRLYYAFNLTQFKLSRYTVGFIITSATIGFFGLMYCLLLYTPKDPVGLTVLLINVATFISWMIFLISLFIYKLIQVYKNVSKNSALISIITKITILSVISITFTVVHCIMLMITTLAFKNKPQIGLHVKMTKDLLHLFSIFINFICILFSYNCFDNEYQSLCGMTNDMCTNLWYYCIGEQKQEPMPRNTITSTGTHTLSISRSNR